LRRVSTDEFQTLLEKVSESGRGKLQKEVYEDIEYLGYQVGLTIQERMLLALHPMIKKVGVYPPAHALALAD
jgi:hypothetical protein